MTENKFNVVSPNDIKVAHAAEVPKAQAHDMTEPKEQGGGGHWLPGPPCGRGMGHGQPKGSQCDRVNGTDSE